VDRSRSPTSPGRGIAIPAKAHGVHPWAIFALSVSLEAG
jgi:hypothetical protein